MEYRGKQKHTNNNNNNNKTKHTPPPTPNKNRQNPSKHKNKNKPNQTNKSPTFDKYFTNVKHGYKQNYQRSMTGTTNRKHTHIKKPKKQH